MVANPLKGTQHLKSFLLTAPFLEAQDELPALPRPYHDVLPPNRAGLTGLTTAEAYKTARPHKPSFSFFLTLRCKVMYAIHVCVPETRHWVPWW